MDMEIMESIEIPPAPEWPRYFSVGSHLVALPDSGRDGKWYVIVRLCCDGTREILLQSDRWEVVYRSLVSLALCVRRHRWAEKAQLN
jgi:hypothetical protein